jgi:hypothetical protein
MHTPSTHVTFELLFDTQTHALTYKRARAHTHMIYIYIINTSALDGLDSERIVGLCHNCHFKGIVFYVCDTLCMYACDVQVLVNCVVCPSLCADKLLTDCSVCPFCIFLTFHWYPPRPPLQCEAVMGPHTLLSLTITAD